MPSHDCQEDGFLVDVKREEEEGQRRIYLENSSNHTHILTPIYTYTHIYSHTNVCVVCMTHQCQFEVPGSWSEQEVECRWQQC